MLNPDWQWYMSQSSKMRLPSRCPLASCEHCPRYYESVVRLANAQALSPLAPEEHARLERKWQPWFVTSIAEEDVEVMWDEQEIVSVRELCPEVSYVAFGCFVSGLFHYVDNDDRENAQKGLRTQGITSAHARYHWWGVTPRHYSGCREYSVLAAPAAGKGKKLPPPASSEEAKDPKAGYVYLIEAIGTDRIKIGHGKSAEQRLRELGTSSPFPLRMLREIPTTDARGLEQMLHARYDAYRKHNEWFILPAEIRAALLEEVFS